MNSFVKVFMIKHYKKIGLLILFFLSLFFVLIYFSNIKAVSSIVATARHTLTNHIPYISEVVSDRTTNFSLQYEMNDLPCDYFVDFDYSGTETGTTDNPFSMLQEAMDVASAGEKVCIKEGTYTILKPENDSADKLRISHINQDSVCSSHLDADMIIVTIDPNSSGFVNLNASGDFGTRSFFTINNSECIHFDGVNRLIINGDAGTFDFAHSLVSINVYDKTGGIQDIIFENSEVKNSHSGRGINVAQDPSSGDISIPSNIIIRDNTIHDIGERAIGVFGNTVYLENNEIYHTGMTNENQSLGDGGWSPAIHVKRHYSTYELSKNIFIRDNYIYDIWGEGIIVTGTDTSEITNNVIKNPFSVGIYSGKSRNITINSNYIFRDSSTYDREISGITGPQNITGISIASESDEYDHPLPENYMISNNIINGVGRGVSYWHDSTNTNSNNSYKDIFVCNNILINLYNTPIRINEVPTGQGFVVPQNANLFNNIIENTDTTSAETYDIPDYTAWSFSNNNWIGGLPTEGLVTQENSYINSEVQIAFAGGIIPLPTVTYTSPNGFKLTADSSSELKNGGTVINAPIYDFWNSPRDSAPSIGIHEYNSATVTSYLLSLTKAGIGAGVVTSNVTGINCGDDCEEEYPENTVLILTATADEGSLFLGWSGGGCTGTNPCEITMNSIKNVNAEFGASYFVVTPVITGDGSITPNGSQSVSPNSILEFILIPDTNYYLYSVTGTCGGELINNIYTTEPITSNCIINIIFQSDQYIVTFNTTDAGTLTGNLVQTINAGGNTTAVTAIPINGYQFLKWTDGNSTWTTNPLVLENIRDNMSLTAIFTSQLFRINAFSSSGGLIIPTGTSLIANHGSQKYSIKADLGYSVSNVIIDNFNYGGMKDYTFENVTSNHIISATFVIDQYNVSTTSTEDGVIEYVNSVLIDGQMVKTFKVLSNDNTHLISVGGTCGGTLNGVKYTTNRILTDCTITAVFQNNSYTVTPISEENGNISPSISQDVTLGDIQEFTILPDSDYSIDEIKGTCNGTFDGVKFITDPITKSCTVRVSFKENKIIAHTNASIDVNDADVGGNKGYNSESGNKTENDINKEYESGSLLTSKNLLRNSLIALITVVSLSVSLSLYFKNRNKQNKEKGMFS